MFFWKASFKTRWLPRSLLAAASCAMTSREVVVTDVTAVAGQSHLPNVLRLAGGQRNVLRPCFLTMGSLSLCTYL